jgi:hypothetical protein
MPVTARRGGAQPHPDSHHLVVVEQQRHADPAPSR